AFPSGAWERGDEGVRGCGRSEGVFDADPDLPRGCISFPSSAWERKRGSSASRLCHRPYALILAPGREAELPGVRSQAELGNEGKRNLGTRGCGRSEGVFDADPDLPRGG